ncbi:hypothetical protein, partial [Actinoplanes rectilineatus]
EASNSWRQSSYNGASPHTEHAHFSSSYETAREASKASWHLEDIPVALTDADKKWLTAQIDARADKIEANILSKLPKATANETLVNTRPDWSADNPADPKSYRRNVLDMIGDPWGLELRGKTRGGDPIPAPGAYGQILGGIEALRAEVQKVLAEYPDRKV